MVDFAICVSPQYGRKRNDVLIHVTAWMILENIMLSETSLLQKTIDCMIPCKGNVQNRQIIGTESRSVVA